MVVLADTMAEAMLPELARGVAATPEAVGETDEVAPTTMTTPDSVEACGVAMLLGEMADTNVLPDCNENEAAVAKVEV